MKKRLLCALAFTFIISSVFSGCGSSAGMKAITLSEAAHTVFYAPLYVAIEKGYFKEEGLKVNLVSGLGSDKTAAALQAGDCDIALMGPENSIYLYSDGAKDNIINFAQLTQRAGDILVSRNLNEEFTWDNIKGKTLIGDREDGLPQMVFEYILKKHGIDPETDLTMILDIDFGFTAQAFSNGQGDYTIEFEPTASTLGKSGSGKIVAALGEESGKVPYTVFSIKKSYLDKYPEIVQKFMNAIQKGLDYTNKHTAEEIAKIIKPQFSESGRDELIQILNGYYEQNTWKENLVFEKGSYTLLEDIINEAGQLKEHIPYENIVTTEYAQKAVSK